jgi:hypothetical protein
MEVHAAAISVASDAQADALERHVAALRRSFQRKLRKKPTVLQRELMNQAALLTARATAAANDPNVTANDLVRLNGMAARLRNEMLASFEEEPLSLAELRL